MSLLQRIFALRRPADAPSCPKPDPPDVECSNCGWRGREPDTLLRDRDDDSCPRCGATDSLVHLL